MFRGARLCSATTYMAFQVPSASVDMSTLLADRYFYSITVCGVYMGSCLKHSEQEEPLLGKLGQPYSFTMSSMMMSEDAFVLLLLSYSFYELGCLGTSLVFRFFSPSYLLFLIFLLSALLFYSILFFLYSIEKRGVIILEKHGR